MAKQMRCISRCQWKGDIVHVDDIVDMKEVDLANPLAKSAFVEVDNAAAGNTAADKTIIVAGLTREQVLLKLSSMKVTIPDGTTDQQLAKIFESTVDPKARSRAK